MLPLSSDILPSSRPMTMIGGVLESPRASLSIGRIVSLIGRPFANRLGQKGGWKVTGSLQIQPTAEFHIRGPFLTKIQYDHR